MVIVYLSFVPTTLVKKMVVEKPCRFHLNLPVRMTTNWSLPLLLRVQIGSPPRVLDDFSAKPAGDVARLPFPFPLHALASQYSCSGSDNVAGERTVAAWITSSAFQSSGSVSAREGKKSGVGKAYWLSTRETNGFCLQYTHHRQANTHFETENVLLDLYCS